MVQILEQLFNSKIRAKIFRLFFRSSNQTFQIDEVARKIKSDYNSVSRELDKLSQMKLLKMRIKRAQHSKKVFQINQKFTFYDELKNLVLKSLPIPKDQILRRIKKLGRVKLALISGVFLSEENCRVDLLIVGENISQRKLRLFLIDLEAEVGREIDYAVISSDDFRYRKSMFDKFILDLFEGPGEVLIDRIGVKR